MKKLLLILGMVLLTGNVYAAVSTNKAVTIQTPNIAVVQFLQGTDVAGTYKTLYTGGANGSKIVSLVANTNDPSAAHLVTCQIKTGGVSYGGTAVNVPVNSGFATGVPSVNLMSGANWTGLPVDSDGNPFIYLPSSSYTLVCTFATALTSTDVLNVQAVVGDF
jgi:hypothetical protein